MPQTVSVGELTDLVVRVFLRHGVSGENAGPVAETVVAAERDGAVSHGLLRLPGYVSTLKSGWVDGRAVPVVTDAAPGLVATEAATGFAQPALRASAPLLREKARRQVSPRWRSAIRTTSPPFGPISSRLRPKGSSRWLW
jgi:delta1-piperideine-2-carboxylate reductase